DSGGRLLGLPQIGQHGLESAEALDCFLVRNPAADDDIVTLLPVGRSRYGKLRSELDGVDGAQYFLEIPAGRHRVGEDELDPLVRADDENRTDRLVVRRSTAFGTVAGGSRQHVVELGDLQLGIPDHRIVDRVAGGGLDVDLPLLVAFHRIHGNTDDLGIALLELTLQA